MDVASVLVQALRAIDEAGIQGELRPIAFSKAVDLLTVALSVPNAEQRPGSSQRAGSQTGQGGRLDEPIERLAARLRLEPESVRQVFDIDGGELNIVVGSGKLDRRQSTGTKQLALLVAAGRQGMGIDADEWTQVSEIRRWAGQYKRLDSPNFASTLKELDDLFLSRGAGQQRSVRLSRPGWDKAAALVAELSGEVNSNGQ